MDHRVPLSPELAGLITRTLATCRRLADDAFVSRGSEFRPAGALKADLDVINRTSIDKKQVQSRLLATGLDGADLARANAFDHIYAIENDILRDPIPIWSPLTLSRSVLESTVMSCHLLDPSITPQMRLARIAALWLDDTEYALQAARTFGATHADNVQGYDQFKRDELAAGGFVINLDKRDRPLRVQLGDASAPLRLNITEAATRLLPLGMPSPYRLGSGAAHSRPWFLERSVTKLPDGACTGEAATAETAPFTAMFCMNVWVTTWSAYFGVDVTRSLAGMDAARLELGRGIISAGGLAESPG